MSDQSSWHSQDDFWELFEPVLFDQERLGSAKTEVEQVVSLLKPQGNDRVLDLCCGVGRHSLEFARMGFEVVAVDRTRSFIQRAKQEAEVQHLEIEFVVGDMRDFRRAASFNLAVNLFGSFGYFEDPTDDRRVTRNVYDSLYPGGKFLVETMGKEIAARDFQRRSWSEDGKTLVLAERKPLQDWGRMQTRWIVIRGSERYEHTVSVRSYSAVELSSLFSACGFADVRVFGDLEGRDYDQEAKRLVVMGSKPAG